MLSFLVGEATSRSNDSAVPGVETTQQSGRSTLAFQDKLLFFLLPNYVYLYDNTHYHSNVV